MIDVKRPRVHRWLVLLLAMPACAEEAEPEASSTSTSDTSSSSGIADTSSTSIDTSSSSTEESSTGEPAPPPMDPCIVAEIAQGIVGRTDLRTCDVEGDCVAPESGVTVWLFDDNPQIGGSESEAGMLDPAVPMLDETTSDANGLFAFALPASSYFACTPDGADMVICSPQMIVVGADPLHAAFYETGNGSSWSARSCIE